MKIKAADIKDGARFKATIKGEEVDGIIFIKSRTVYLFQDKFGHFNLRKEITGYTYGLCIGTTENECEYIRPLHGIDISKFEVQISRKKRIDNIL
jgi:hypothetical protein